MRVVPVPALPSAIIEPVWDQVSVLLPPHPETQPRGCHRPRISDRVVVDKLIQVPRAGVACPRRYLAVRGGRTRAGR